MSNHYEMYHDPPTSRSPGSHRHHPQPLPPQSSRNFDAYGPLSTTGLYTADDHAAARGYDGSRYGDRINSTMHTGYPQPQYELGGTQPWNTTGYTQNNALNSLNLTTRMKQPQRGRTALPSAWLETPSMPTIQTFGGLGPAVGQPAMRQDPFAQPEVDEELIPTAIVIKNIPFAVKKEQLVQLMTDMRLPLPYAFNYHFDNGVFRGLAFANFTTAEETATVIEAMNHFELHGRKLRVEYKKMLPLAERERIEREKRERRGQLEEQHRPMTNAPSLQHSSSFTSNAPAASPSPVSRNPKLGRRPWMTSQSGPTDQATEYDLNDPQVLQFYSQLLLFKEDGSRESLVFPPSLAPTQRRVIHTLAHQMGLMHISKGIGEQRQVHVFKLHEGPNLSPPIPQLPASHGSEPHRRALNRAATTDFSDVRGSDGFYGTLGRQGSGFLGFPDSPGGLTAAPNLRAAKSYADLRSYTPSPVPSTASFPATLNTNFSRFTDYGTASSGPNQSVTPTATSMSQRDESLLVNGLNGMNLGGGFGSGGSPRGLRGMMSWDRSDNPGPIGGHRSFSTNYDEQSRDRSQSGLPSRQPRGPLPGNPTGFTRSRQNGHHGRGSDELSSQSGVEIVVEREEPES